MAVPGKIRQGGVDGGGSKGGGEWGKKGDGLYWRRERRWKRSSKADERKGWVRSAFYRLAVWMFRWLSSLRCYYWQLVLCACMCISAVCLCMQVYQLQHEKEKVWTSLPQYLHVYVRLTSLAPNLGKIGHCSISISEKLKLETKGFLSGERSPGLAASSPSSSSSK